jgi:1-acyl-sn-glycerol-3-phosphate acyltransferase
MALPMIRAALGWLRLLWRLPAFVVLSLGCSMPLLAAGWFVPAEIHVRWQDRVFRFWARLTLRILGVRLRWEGEPPRPPFFVVSNHLSYLDLPVLARGLPCVFVAKAEIDTWPIIAAASRSVGTLFIDRSRKLDVARVIEEVRRVLASGRGVVVFPEGTSGSGDEILPFRSSLLELPATLAMPVYHATIHYRTPAGEPPARDVVCWWGGTHLGPHLMRFLRLPRVEAWVRLGDEPFLHADRKALAEALRNAVVRNLEQLRGEIGEETPLPAGEGKTLSRR